MIIAGRENGELLTLEGDTGKLLWEYKVPSTPRMKYLSDGRSKKRNMYIEN